MQEKKKKKTLILFPGEKPPPQKTPSPTDEAKVLKRALNATVCVLFHHTNEINGTIRGW